MVNYAARSSERRTEHLLNDLLDAQGWDRRRPPLGHILLQHEYRVFPEYLAALQNASKSGNSAGVPEAIIVDNESQEPLAIIEAKASRDDIQDAIDEARHYASSFFGLGYTPVAIGLAGGEDHDFQLSVSKWSGSGWEIVTYDGKPIEWIPTSTDMRRLAFTSSPAELRPTMPPAEVLADRADEINRLLRESDIRDGDRPAVVAAVMVALWQAGRSNGEVRRDPRNILRDINQYCADAFGTKKFLLANSLKVDPANTKLAKNAKRIVSILERLNISVLTAEHDYLGQLYETFFRYTGGNTIGQYFTPRHIAGFMAELTDVGEHDVVLDPACGSGGFLIAAMHRMLLLRGEKRDDAIHLIARQLLGFESEPVTAALCVANMILRGDGSTGIYPEDSLSSKNFPMEKVNVALLNPPFPHKSTDKPAEAFIDRALTALRPGGKLAAVIPTSILSKRSKGKWRAKILRHNHLEAVCQLPDDLFQPYASATTSIVLLTKGKKHDPSKQTVFVRIHHDGYSLKKGARLERVGEPNQLPAALDAVRNKRIVPGFSGTASISNEDEWAVGGYVPSAPPEEEDIRAAVDVLLRRLTSFYARYAPEIVAQREAIIDGDLFVANYEDLLTPLRKRNAESLTAEQGSVAEHYNIYYGMKELHSRDGIALGKSLIVSPTEEYNGCYGWLDFPQLMKPPFVTVAQTGSIGEAFIQLEPCAVNDDCLVLIPKESQSEAALVILAATLQAEKWRFSYGRKLTPQRIAGLKVPSSLELMEWTEARLADSKAVIGACLAPYLRGTKTAEVGFEIDYEHWIDNVDDYEDRDLIVDALFEEEEISIDDLQTSDETAL